MQPAPEGLAQAFHIGAEHIGFTVPYNMSEQPASSVPAGYTADGRTIGLQVAGPESLLGHGDRLRDEAGRQVRLAAHRGEVWSAMTRVGERTQTSLAARVVIR